MNEIGPTIVKSLCMKLDTKLIFDSNVHRGATVRFYIPTKKNCNSQIIVGGSSTFLATAQHIHNILPAIPLFRILK